MKHILVSVLLVIMAATAALAQSESKASPSVARVLSNVRKAINYRKLKELKPGFLIEEAEAASGSDSRILWLGSSGEFKQESKPSDNRPLGFDGKFGWQVDRTGLPAPMPQRLREKLLIPAWVRSGWWLNDAAPFVFSILPEETNDQQVALSMKLEGGLVGAKIYVDRATWLPAKLVVEYERGPYTLVLKDYQESLGFRLPQRTVTNYRGSDLEYTVNTVTEITGSNRSQFLRYRQTRPSTTALGQS